MPGSVLSVDDVVPLLGRLPGIVRDPVTFAVVVAAPPTVVPVFAGGAAAQVIWGEMLEFGLTAAAVITVRDGGGVDVVPATLYAAGMWHKIAKFVTNRNGQGLELLVATATTISGRFVGRYI